MEKACGAGSIPASRMGQEVECAACTWLNIRRLGNVHKMPENDIYNNKGKYEQFLRSLEQFAVPPSERTNKQVYKAIYYCRNVANMKYFHVLAQKFDSRDTRFIYAGVKEITWLRKRLKRKF